MSYKRIMVAVDGSDISDLALNKAIRLSQIPIYLIHAEEPA